MAFLDNSGDIILDAVLTDTGRKRLAAADGSFRIAKFALADDEIDYGLYRNANSLEGIHPSGSAYYDLNILQTPVLEAFTNNTSLMKSKSKRTVASPVVISSSSSKFTIAFVNLDHGKEHLVYVVNIPVSVADFTLCNPDHFPAPFIRIHCSAVNLLDISYAVTIL